MTDTPKDPAASSSGRRFTDSIEQPETVIGPRLRIDGELSGTPSIELRGTIEGKVRTEGLLRVAAGGKLVGEVDAGHVVIEGEIEGTVKASEKVELRPTSKLHGDVVARAVAIAEGAFMDGRVQMGGGKRSGATHFQEKRKT